MTLYIKGNYQINYVIMKHIHIIIKTTPGANYGTIYYRDRRSPSISGSRISNLPGSSAQNRKVFTVHLDPATCMSPCLVQMISDARECQKVKENKFVRTDKKLDFWYGFFHTLW